MELKPTFTSLFLLFLLLHTVPCLSRGQLKVSNMDSGIYEIDYRGPETHSYIPPPNRSGGRPRPNVHGESVMAHHKIRGSGHANSRRIGRKVHG